MLQEFTVYFNTNAEDAASAAAAVVRSIAEVEEAPAATAAAAEGEGEGTMHPGQHASPREWLPPSPSEL
eukprot:SAG22_NODE_491_length_9827_cov_6.501028_1_plen_69_part_00